MFKERATTADLRKVQNTAFCGREGQRRQEGMQDELAQVSMEHQELLNHMKGGKAIQ
ncbi:hypothetical protein HPG69_018373 [Diceros bicornis minor]|uniref:Uncharacterized protein n=1 Tax=Diceros bicornis minor TaxID=77932 RepID=A0A7J7FEN2_DICBM|nr:hypothetical protein HPG69_018373 [Diceros bicornis minor]